MKIKDREIGRMVDVACKECQKYKCYWPRRNPGSFTSGVGYKSYGDNRDNEYLCGNREIRGCPDTPEFKNA